MTLFRAASLEREREQRIPTGHQDVLLAVERVRLRRVRHVSQPRVPQRRAVRWIEGDEIASAIAGEQQTPGRGEEARVAGVRHLVAPRDLRGDRIDRGDGTARRDAAAALYAAQPHRSAGI